MFLWNVFQYEEKSNESNFKRSDNDPVIMDFGKNQ